MMPFVKKISPNAVAQALEARLLTSTFDLDPSTMVRWPILAKVVDVKEVVVKTMYGKKDVRRVTLKDKLGNKNILSVWGNNYQDLFVGFVCIFKNVMVEDFPNDRPYHLKACKSTYIQFAPLPYQDELENISIVDGSMKNAAIIGIQNVYLFQCCKTCKATLRKDFLKEGKNCYRCDEKIEKPVKEFKFTLVVQEKGEDDFKHLIGCGNVLGIKEFDNVKNLEEKLNVDFIGKEVHLEFIRENINNSDTNDTKVEFIIHSLRF